MKNVTKTLYLNYLKYDLKDLNFRRAKRVIKFDLIFKENLFKF